MPRARSAGRSTSVGSLSVMRKQDTYYTPEMQDLLVRLFGADDDLLQAIERDAAAAGFPPIAVTALDGHILRFLVAACRARHAVEIGTLGGYSALWIARALPAGGRLDCFELDAERAAFAQAHIDAAGLDVEVVVHTGPASENLADVAGPVDFVFIDADKQGYPAYLEWAAAHLRAGGIVALDNAFAWGGVLSPRSVGLQAPDARAMRDTLEALASDPRFVAAMVPTNEGLAAGVRTDA